MSSLLRQLRDQATVGWRAVKETRFSTPETDPDFSVACEHVDLLLKRFRIYARDVRSVVGAFLACGNSGMDICHSLAAAVQDMDGCGPVATTVALRDFFGGADGAIREKLLAGRTTRFSRSWSRTRSSSAR
jgi:hypothetical protein